MQVFCVAEEQDGVLTSEDRTQRGKGLGGTTEVGGNGLALHHGVGMPTETCRERKDPGVTGLHPQQHLPQ